LWGGGGGPAVGWGFEVRASCLQSRYHLSYTYRPFCSDYFGDGIL
jgi:hypothetical protein